MADAQTPLKTDALAVENQTVPVTYFASRTLRGGIRYSADVLLGPSDHIILDDDSMPGLEVRTVRLLTATVYSRTLAGRATAL